MLRAVLDTNVVVSALIRPGGPPGRILDRLVDGDFVLVLSPAMLDELGRTVRQPGVRKYVRLSDDELDSRLAQLETLADPVEGTLALTVALRDPDDLMVLVTAVEGRADYIVTGDADLLTLGACEGVAIVTPREFLERLGA